MLTCSFDQEVWYILSFPFLLIYLRSIGKPVFLTYINHFRHLIADVINHQKGIHTERRDASFPFIGNFWYNLKFIFGMTRPHIGSNQEPHTLEADTLPLGHRDFVITFQIQIFWYHFKLHLWYEYYDTATHGIEPRTSLHTRSRLVTTMPSLFVRFSSTEILADKVYATLFQR